MSDDLNLHMGIEAHDGASPAINAVRQSLNELNKTVLSIGRTIRKSMGEDFTKAISVAASASTKFSAETTSSMTRVAAAIRADVQAVNDLANAYGAATRAQRDFNRGNRGGRGGGGGRPPAPPNVGPDLREIRRRWTIRERSARAEVSEINNVARAEAQRQRSVLDNVARTWRLRQASERDQLRHMNTVKRERDAMRRQMNRKVSEVYGHGRHALRSVNHPEWSSIGFWVTAGAAFGVEAGKHLIDAAKALDTQTTRYGMMPGVNPAEAAKVRSESLREGIRLGIDPAEVVKLRLQGLKDGLSPEISKILPSAIQAALQTMGGDINRDGDELAKAVREASTVGWVKTGDGARSLMNQVAGLSTFNGNSPEKMQQFLASGGIGRGAELGWSQQQTLAFGAALNGSGERTGLGSARLMAQLPEIMASVKDRYLKATRSRDNSEENRAIRSAPSKLGYGSISELQSAFKSPEGVVSLFSRLQGLDQKTRAQIEKGLGLGPQFNAVSAEMGAEHGERYRTALKRENELSGQNASNDTLSKNSSTWSTSIEFMVDQLKASVEAVQAELVDVIKEDILKPFTGWWVNISQALLDGSMKQDLHLAIKSFLQGLGFEDMASALNALRGSVGNFDLAGFMRGVGEGLREVIDDVKAFANALGFMSSGGDARTLGRLSAELLGLSLGLRVISPVVTLIAGVASGILALKAAVELGGWIGELTGLSNVLKTIAATEIGTIATGLLSIAGGLAAIGVAVQGLLSAGILPKVTLLPKSTSKEGVDDWLWGKNKDGSSARPAWVDRLMGTSPNGTDGDGLVKGPHGGLMQRQSYDGDGFASLRQDIAYAPSDSADTVRKSMVATAIGVFEVKDSVDQLAAILKRSTGNPLAGDGEGAEHGGGSGGRPSIRYGHSGGSLGGAMPNLRYGHGGTTPGSGQAREIGPHVSLGKMGGKFAAKAPVIVDGLMKKYGLTREQAAGIVGNLGHESAGFTAYHEGGQASSKGGVGWAQWTGPRRRAFEKWTASHGLNPTSDEASWRYLTEGDPETAKAILAVKRTNNRRDAVRAWEQSFERAGVKAYGSRDKFADQAYAGTPGGATVTDKPLGTAANPVVVKPDPKSIKSGMPDNAGIAESVVKSRNGGPKYDAGSGNSTSTDNSNHTYHINVHGASDPKATVQAMQDHIDAKRQSSYLKIPSIV